MFLDENKHPRVGHNHAVGFKFLNGVDELGELLCILVMRKEIKGQVDLLSSVMGKPHPFDQLLETHSRPGAQGHIRRAGVHRIGAVENSGLELRQRSRG